MSAARSRVAAAERGARGAQYVKCGFAGDNFPRHSIPSMVGRPMLRAEEEAVGDVTLKVRRSAVM